MITVNLFDSAFSHLSCSVHGKTAKRIQYVRSRLRWDGITLLTDDMLCRSRTLDHLKSRITIGWLLEPRDYKPGNYRIAESLLPRLDLLLTHDQALIGKYPDKVRFVPFGGCWIPEADWGIADKTQQVSIVYSRKRFLPGHQLRHEAADILGPARAHGSGAGLEISYESRAAILRRSQFSIVIENSRAINFFTEKLLDCFALGTVPIYWGCPNIFDFFDDRAIIPFQTIEELSAILADLNYDRHQLGAEANLERMKQYAITDDWISEHILEGL